MFGDVGTPSNNDLTKIPAGRCNISEWEAQFPTWLAESVPEVQMVNGNTPRHSLREKFPRGRRNDDNERNIAATAELECLIRAQSLPSSERLLAEMSNSEKAPEVDYGLV